MRGLPGADVAHRAARRGRSRSRATSKRRLREILALSEEQLVAGLGGARAGAIADEFERLDVDGLREAVDAVGPRGRLSPRPRLSGAPARPRRRSRRALRGRRRRPAGGARRRRPRAGAARGRGGRDAARVGGRPRGRARARARAGGRRGDRGQRHGARRRQRRPRRGAGVQRTHGGGAGGRGGRALPAEQGAPARADRRARLRRRRAAAGVRGAAVVLSGSQPHHRGAGRR